MGFSRQEHWSESHAFLYGLFPTQGLNPCLSPALTDKSTGSATLEAQNI